jgi:glycosyltransferase involved in cell wall biosynthesis
MKSSRGSNRRRVCIVAHSYYPQDPRVRREARVAVASGYDVEAVVLRRTGESSTEYIDGVHVRRLPIEHRSGAAKLYMVVEYVRFTLHAGWVIARPWWRRPYAIVHVHNPPDFLVAAALIPKLRGAKVILDIHDISSDMYAMRSGGDGGSIFGRLLAIVERLSARISDAVVTVHEPYRSRLADRGVPIDKVSVVMNSLDESGIKAEAASADRAREDNATFRVVYHGTVTWHYGVSLLVEAVAQARDSVPEIALSVLGEGDAVAPARARAQELGIEEVTYFSETFLPHAETLASVRSSSVGVIPNLPIPLNDYALSSKLFEYIVLNLPAVVADLPTLRRHFSDSEVLFFEPGNADSLATALVEVAQNQETARARAEAALARYRNEYAWPVQAERLAALFARLTESSGAK